MASRLASVVVAALLLVGASFRTDAACNQARPIVSFDLDQSSYVYSPVCGPSGCADNDGKSVSPRTVGSFWALGLGNPVVGAGIDSGSLTALDGILSFYPGYPAVVNSNWNKPGVDGCIDQSNVPTCTALALADLTPDCESTGDSCVHLAVATAAERDPGNSYVFSSPDGRIDLETLPSVKSPGLEDRDIVYSSFELTVPRPASTAYLDPACEDPLAGYRIYMRPDIGRPPVTRAGWILPAHGGTGPDGAPIPFDTPTRVVFGCDEYHNYHDVFLAYSVVFKDGYELPWVEILDLDYSFYPPYLPSEDGEVYCCVDLDADANCVGWAPTQILDCDDHDPTVLDRGEQLCGDLKNNDCRHPAWPDLAGTNEVDNDGDGLSACDGDCNDRDPSIFVPAIERDVCDGHDNNCNGRFDEVPDAWLTVRPPGVPETEHFGVSVAGLPDGRFLAGARQESVGAVARAGAVHVFTSTTGFSYTSQRIVSPAPGQDDSFGIAVAAVGDVDGDGQDDFVVGANLDDVGGVVDSGRAFVFSGSEAAGFPLIHTLENPDPDPDDQLGYSVAALDDLDDDGIGDLVVGVRNDEGTGSAVVFSGATGAWIRTLRDPAGNPADLFGYAVGAIEDLDGDGVGEVVVGAYAADSVVAVDAGKVFLLSGIDGSVLLALHDPLGATGRQLGRSVAAIPDRDGDGLADVLAGAPALGSGAGAAVVFSSVTGEVLARLADPAGEFGDAFGYRLAALGDLDGDAVGELVIGAFGDDTDAGADAGSVFVYSGATLVPLRLDEPSFGAGALLGAAVARLADVDGDGVDDIGVGAWGSDVQAGPVYVDAGRVLVVKGAVEVDFDRDGFGDACDPDDDGDGVSDEADCAPRQANVSALPLPVDSIHFELDDRYVTWDVEPGTYGRIYRAKPASWTDAPEFTCIGTDGRGLFFDSTIPERGKVFAYLVRAVNSCGPGPLGTDSDGNERIVLAECP